jgi:hypothetical protein
LLIAFPNADDPPSGNHESLESKIPKRKKARPNTRLSCKIEYFIETTSAYRSGRSAFFTDDQFGSRSIGIRKANAYFVSSPRAPSSPRWSDTAAISVGKAALTRH